MITSGKVCLDLFGCALEYSVNSNVNLRPVNISLIETDLFVAIDAESYDEMSLQQCLRLQRMLKDWISWRRWRVTWSRPILDLHSGIAAVPSGLIRRFELHVIGLLVLF